jgi:hypothetical protein
MSDEFDDAPWPSSSSPGTVEGSARRGRESVVPDLIVRAYVDSSPGLRARLLECLTRPLSVLGLAAVATGAFARYALLSGRSSSFALDDVAVFSGEQILELVRFVEQVSPEALHQCTALIAMVL